MADEGTDIVAADASAEVARTHGAEMSNEEFVQWMNTTFGALGLTQALQQAAFMLCCDVISQDIAKATLRLRELLDNGTSKVVMPTRHPIAELLATEPNRRHTWYEVIEMLVLWHCFSRNAFAGIIRSNRGDVLELLPFRTPQVLEKVQGRDVFYDVFAGTMAEQALLGSTMMTFAERDMIHVRGRLVDGMDGLSTLEVGHDTLQTGRAIEEYRNKLFGEDGELRGVFKKGTPGALNELAFQRLQQQMRIKMARLRNGEPLILEDGLEFQSISADPSDLELTKQFQAQVLATCRLLRVPPHKVFELDGTKYENLETQEKSYIADTLMPICTQFESRFKKALLTGKDRLRFFFQFDRDEITPRDTKAETERAVKALERGGITIDEFRARMGYNPLPNGHGAARLIPVNMNVVDEDGNVVIGAKADKPSDKPAEGEDPNAEDGASDNTKDARRLRVVR